jgi:hypothetical protein
MRERERDGLTANGSEGCRFESSMNSSEYFFRVHIFVFMGTVCELCFQDTYLAGANTSQTRCDWTDGPSLIPYHRRVPFFHL